MACRPRPATFQRPQSLAVRAKAISLQRRGQTQRKYLEPIVCLLTLAFSAFPAGFFLAEAGLASSAAAVPGAALGAWGIQNEAVIHVKYLYPEPFALCVDERIFRLTARKPFGCGAGSNPAGRKRLVGLAWKQ